MAVSLPNFPGEFYYRVRVQLTEDAFLFDFRWNERDSAWYMSMFDLEEDPIFQGVKVVTGTPLGHRKWFDDRWPGGVFFAIDTSGADADPGFDDLGARVEIYWFDDDEVLAFA